MNSLASKRKTVCYLSNYALIGEMFNFIGNNGGFIGESMTIRRLARSETRQIGDGMSAANFAI